MVSELTKSTDGAIGLMKRDYCAKCGKMIVPFEILSKDVFSNFHMRVI